MGTNYYWRDSPCEHCGRYEEIHVGKSSVGWSFAFRIYPHELFSEENPDWGYDPSSPFGFPVLSRADWRKVFTERSGTLWDEYGRRIDSPVGWIDGLVMPDDRQLAEESSRLSGPGYDRDGEGFRVLDREFS